MQSKFFAAVILTLFTASIFLFGISRIPVIDGDEGRFVQASRQMIESGNYLEINFLDHGRHRKPPGIYWLQASITKLVTPGAIDQVWSYRLASVLGGVLSVLLLFFLFGNENSVASSFWSAMILASSFLLVFESHVATADAMLLACIVLMQGGLWRTFCAYRASRSVHWWPWVFWLGMTAGILIKGMSLVIGLLTIAGICLGERSWRFLRALRWLPVVCLLFVIAIVFTLVSLNSDTSFLGDMWHKEILPKIFGSAQGHGAPPGYFLLLMPVLFWPGSIWLWQGVVQGWRQRQCTCGFFLLAWLLPVWIFIELIHTKLPEYALPFFPAVALMIGQLLSSPSLSLRGVWKNLEIGYRSWWLILSLVIASIVPVIEYLLMHSIDTPAWLFFAVVVMGSVVAYVLSYRQAYTVVLAVLMLSALVAYGLLYNVILPSWSPIWLSHRVAQRIHALHLPSSVYNYSFREPSMAFNVGDQHIRFASTDKSLDDYLKNVNVRYLLIKQSEWPGVQQRMPNQFKPVFVESGFNYDRGRWVDVMLIQRALSK